MALHNKQYPGLDQQEVLKTAESIYIFGYRSWKVSLITFQLLINSLAFHAKARLSHLPHSHLAAGSPVFHCHTAAWSYHTHCRSMCFLCISGVLLIQCSYWQDSATCHISREWSRASSRIEWLQRICSHHYHPT